MKAKRSEGGGRDGGQDDEEGKITAKEEGKTTKTEDNEEEGHEDGTWQREQ